MSIKQGNGLRRPFRRFVILIRNVKRLLRMSGRNESMSHDDCHGGNCYTTTAIVTATAIVLLLLQLLTDTAIVVVVVVVVILVCAS